MNEQKGHSTELGFVTNVIGYDSRYTFSAKEKDDETQYSYFGARYYDSDLSVWLSVDPMAHIYPSTSPYIYCLGNPVGLIDPDGMASGKPDNFLIKEGEEGEKPTVSKEETNDPTNTYTYQRRDGTKLDLGTYSKETNSKGEDMTKAGDGATGENDMFKWVGIVSGNMYYPEDGFALLLGAIQNFYDNTPSNVEKVTFNQFMSVERTHTGSPNYPPSIDVLYYSTNGKAGALTDGANLSDDLNYQLLSTFKDFGLGVNSNGAMAGRDYAVYSSKSKNSDKLYFTGTIGSPGHNNHFHFSGYDSSRITSYQTVGQKGLNRLRNGL